MEEDTHFVYDVDDRMVHAHNDSLSVHFAYDGAGNRIQKTIVALAAGDTTLVRYTYDGLHLL